VSKDADRSIIVKLPDSHRSVEWWAW